MFFSWTIMLLAIDWWPNIAAYTYWTTIEYNTGDIPMTIQVKEESRYIPWVNETVYPELSNGVQFVCQTQLLLAVRLVIVIHGANISCYKNWLLSQFMVRIGTSGWVNIYILW